MRQPGGTKENASGFHERIRHYLISNQVPTSCQDESIFLKGFSIYTAWILLLFT
jgi:hypothetical protein